VRKFERRCGTSQRHSSCHAEAASNRTSRLLSLIAEEDFVVEHGHYFGTTLEHGERPMELRSGNRQEHVHSVLRDLLGR
jgi:hypothetical protein